MVVISLGAKESAGRDGASTGSRRWRFARDVAIGPCATQVAFDLDREGAVTGLTHDGSKSGGIRDRSHVR
jgi:hypothetical protein